jgi:hypothetical protein
MSAYPTPALRFRFAHPLCMLLDASFAAAGLRCRMMETA